MFQLSERFTQTALYMQAKWGDAELAANTLCFSELPEVLEQRVAERRASPQYVPVLDARQATLDELLTKHMARRAKARVLTVHLLQSAYIRRHSVDQSSKRNCALLSSHVCR